MMRHETDSIDFLPCPSCCAALRVRKQRRRRHASGPGAAAAAARGPDRRSADAGGFLLARRAPGPRQLGRGDATAPGGSPDAGMPDRCLSLRISDGGSGRRHHPGLRRIDGAQRFGSPCQGERPIVLYAHGTNTDKAFNMADLEVGQRRGSPDGRGVRGGGLHRRGAELRGLRHLDARLSPLPQWRAAIQRHDRCADGRPQRPSYRGRSRPRRMAANCW